MMLMQHMEALSLDSKQPLLQQQQRAQLQLKSSSSQGTSSSGAVSSLSGGSGSLAPALLGSAAASGDAKDAAAAATAAICNTAPTAGSAGVQHPAGASGEGVDVDSITAAAAVVGGSGELQSGTAAAAAAIAAAALGGSNGSNGGGPPSPSAAAAASLERLEGAVRAALGRPLPQPMQQQQQQQQQLQMQLRAPAGQALQLQGTLPALQRLMKSLVSEIMQLVLQINKEQAGPGAKGSAAVAAAAARLQHIRQQVYGEFRAFSTTNRIDMCLLYSLVSWGGRMSGQAGATQCIGAPVVNTDTHCISTMADLQDFVTAVFVEGLALSAVLGTCRMLQCGCSLLVGNATVVVVNVSLYVT
jgi:hypothetical protein